MEAFRADPAGHPILRAAYYNVPIPEKHLDRIRKKLARCVDNLLACPLWPEISEYDPQAVKVVDSVQTIRLHKVTVYVAPDLVYVTPQGAHVVCDWKTGQAADSEAQVALYGLYARDVLGARAEDGLLWGRVFLWGEHGAELSFALGKGALRRAEDRCSASVAAMRVLLTDPVRNRALPMGAFPLPDAGDRGQCDWCSFTELCRQELSLTRTPDAV